MSVRRDVIREIAHYLGELDQPVITDYQLAVVLFDLYEKGNGTVLTKRRLATATGILQGNGIITQHRDFSENKVFSIIGKKTFDPGDVACSVDPFCYVSHLNAMSYHGLTDRIPSVLILSSPSPKEWKLFANRKMEKDLGESIDIYRENRLPPLQSLKMNKIGKHPIEKYSSVHLGAFKNIKGRSLRVSSLGRTFLDMVREPKQCGGMTHVVEVYRNYAKQYKRLIIDEVDRNGAPIEKVRVGYLLEEICHLNDDKLTEWLKYVARGGSRKLDPNEEYYSKYSEKWSISINITSSDEES